MPPRKKTATTTSEIVPMTETPQKVASEKNLLSSLETLKLQIQQQFITIVDQLITGTHTVDAYKKQIEEDTSMKERQRIQRIAEEDLTYELGLRKKQAEFDTVLEKEKETFATYKRTQEELLRTKRDELDTKEESLNALQKQVDSFPKQLEKSVEEAKKQVSLELKKDFDTEKKLSVQKSESDIKLLQQQIAQLQHTLKQQEKEIIILKEEKTRAVEQMKDLAVAVIKGKDAPPSESSSFE